MNIGQLSGQFNLKLKPKTNVSNTDSLSKKNAADNSQKPNQAQVNTDKSMTKDGSVFDAGRTNNAARAQETVSAVNTQATNNVNNQNNAAKANQNTNNTQAAEDDKKSLDISNIDFDNLTGVTDAELKNLKGELTELKDDPNLSRAMENSINSKLKKVNSEMKDRAANSIGSAQGAAVEKDAAKTEDTAGAEQSSAVNQQRKSEQDGNSTDSSLGKINSQTSRKQTYS